MPGKKTFPKKPAKKSSYVKKKKSPGKIASRKIVSGKKKTAVKRTAKARKRQLQKSAIIGRVTHYFPHVNAAVAKLKSALKGDDMICIKGHTTDFKQIVTSMQINHVSIKEAKKGSEIGLLVSSRVRAGDIIYKV